MNTLSNYPPVPENEKTISDAAVELSHRIVRHAYTFEQDVKEEIKEDPISLVLAYASLLLGQCGACGISPGDAMNAAYHVIGTRLPGRMVH